MTVSSYDTGNFAGWLDLEGIEDVTANCHPLSSLGGLFSADDELQVFFNL